MKRDLGYAADIVLASGEVADFLHNLTREEFLQTSMIRSAVERQLEIIGEATKAALRNKGSK